MSDAEIRRFVVRYNVEFSAVVEAKSPEDAVEVAQKQMDDGTLEWDRATSPIECDGEEEP